MASQSNALTRGQLAYFSGQEIEGLGRFKTETEQQYQFKQLGLQEAGCHCKCYAVVFGILALLAAAGGAWALVSHIQHDVFISSLLGGVALVSLATVVVQSLLSVRKQQALEAAFNQAHNAEISFETIREGMEEDKASATSIQTVVGRLEEAQRANLINYIWGTYFPSDRSTPLTAVEKKVFYGVLNNPASQLIIHQQIRNNSAIALLVLSCLDADCPVASLHFLIQTIELPKSPEQADLLARFPNALQSYLESLDEKGRTSYVQHFLRSATPNAADHIMFITDHCLQENPSTEETARLYSRHPWAVGKKAAASREFGLAMLQFLPADQDPELLLKLLKIVGPSQTVLGVAILYRHPKALKVLISQAGHFVLGYFKHALNPQQKQDIRAPHDPNEIASFAKEPETLAQLIISTPLWFTPEVVYSIFQKMTESNQVTFLNTLEAQDTPANSPAYRRRAEIVQYVLLHHLTPEFANKYTNVIPSIIDTNYIQLLQQFGKWPTLLAERLFIEAWGTSQSLTRVPKFLELCLNTLSALNLQICAKRAAEFFEQRKDGVSIYTAWLKEYEVFWQKQIMLVSPNLLATTLCTTTTTEVRASGELLVNHMSTNNQARFRLKYLESFKEAYELHVFAKTLLPRDDLEDWTNRLIQQVRYLDQHPEWVAQNSEIAQRYFELFINAEMQESALLANLLNKHRDLFRIYKVESNGLTVDIPLYRLVTLSPYFEKLLSSNTKHQKTTKTIELNDDSNISSDTTTAAAFLTYLSTGKVECTGDNILELSHLAQKYAISQLSAMCTIWVRNELNDLDVTQFETILEAAVSYELWDLRCVCLEFIAKNTTVKQIRQLPKKFGVTQAVKDFVLFGIECSKQSKIPISYAPATTTTHQSSHFGCYLSVGQNRRVMQVLPTHTFAQMDTIVGHFQPTEWGVTNSAEAALLCLKAHQEELPKWTSRWLDCIQTKSHNHQWETLSPEQLCQLYVLCLDRQDKQKLAQDIFKRIHTLFKAKEIKILLKFGSNQGVLALKILSLKIITGNPTAAAIVALSLDTGLSPAEREITALGNKCIEAKISFGDLQATNYHVYIKNTAIDDVAIETITSLHRQQKITQLHVPLACLNEIQGRIDHLQSIKLVAIREGV